MELKIDKELCPNRYAIAKYQQEIEYWEEQLEVATERHDWDARNWASTQLLVKRDALKRLLEKVKNNKKKTYD